MLLGETSVATCTTFECGWRCRWVAGPALIVLLEALSPASGPEASCLAGAPVRAGTVPPAGSHSACQNRPTHSHSGNWVPTTTAVARARGTYKAAAAEPSQQGDRQQHHARRHLEDVSRSIRWTIRVARHQPHRSLRHQGDGAEHERLASKIASYLKPCHCSPTAVPLSFSHRYSASRSPSSSRTGPTPQQQSTGPATGQIVSGSARPTTRIVIEF